MASPASTAPSSSNQGLAEFRQSNQTTSRSLEKMLTQCRIVREARGASERFVRFLVSIQQSQQMPARGPEWLIVDDAALRQSIECIQPGGRIACLGQRHGASRCADAWREPDQDLRKAMRSPASQCYRFWRTLRKWIGSRLPDLLGGNEFQLQVSASARKA
jgi:hypothetical protein